MITDDQIYYSNLIQTASSLIPIQQQPQFPPTQLTPCVQDLICFSHLRWNFVYQRPQHLLSRASRQWRVWYVEEPVWQHTLHLQVRIVAENLWVVVPHLPHGIDEQTAVRLQRQLVNQLLDQQNITNYIAWYYTPMALPFTAHLRP